MAVTITKTETPQYSEVNGHLSGCIGGGSDYRSIDGGSSLLYGDYLICKGWFGENLSDACKLVSVKLINSQFRVRTTLDSWTALSCSVRLRLLEVRGTVSGTKMSNISGGARTETKNVTINESNNWQTVNNFENDLQQAFVANQRYLALKLDFNSSNISTVRCYVRNLQFEITRTRACYITFKGDGVTEKKTMYDYGASVSFGGTPTRAGYRFKGWSNGSTTYTGALPTAGEVDVTYTAVWEAIPKHYLTLVGSMDGQNVIGIDEMGTVDVYINGSLSKAGCTEFSGQYEEGTAYEIKNIKAKAGWKFDEAKSKNLKGTLNNSVDIIVAFVTEAVQTKPEFTHAGLTYGGQAVSPTNKVPAGQVCILAVGISNFN